MVEPVETNRKIISRWIGQMVNEFNLGDTKLRSSPPLENKRNKKFCALPRSNVNPELDERPTVYLPNSGRWLMMPDLNAHLHEAAASDREGHATFHRTGMKNREGGEETGGLDSDRGTVDKVEVPLVTVDRLWAQFGLARGYESIFLLKVDVEGNEPNVFKGMSSVLEKRIIEIIFFECKKRADLRVIAPLLHQHGYDVFVVSRFGLRAVHLDLGATSIYNDQIVEKWPDKWMNLMAMKNDLYLKPAILNHMHSSNFRTQTSIGQKIYGIDYGKMKNILKTEFGHIVQHFGK